MTKEEAIYKVLSENTDIKAVVGKRVYPVIAPASTDFPYLTYSTQSSAQPGTKDGNERTVVVSVSFVEKNYLSAHEHANLIMPAIFSKEDILAEGNLFNPEFLQEQDAYNLNCDAYMVSTDFTLEFNK